MNKNTRNLRQRNAGRRREMWFLTRRVVRPVTTQRQLPRPKAA